MTTTPHHHYSDLTNAAINADGMDEVYRDAEREEADWVTKRREAREARRARSAQATLFEEQR